MWRRWILVFAVAIVLGSWAICGLTYARDGGGAYNTSVFALLILLAAGLTVGAASTVVASWRAAKVRVVGATTLSVLASASILVLAIAINSRG
jgi:hypothetical protein